MSGQNQIRLIVRATSGTWPDARFNVNNRVQKILDEGVRRLGLDPSPAVPYRMTRGGQALSLTEKIEDVGLREGDTVVIEAGQPVDG